MPIIIDDNEKFKAELVSAFKSGEIDIPFPIAIINAEYLPDQHSRRSDYKGIAEAEKAVHSGNRAILYEFQTMPVMYLIHSFAMLLAEHPNEIRYIRAPFPLHEVTKAFDIPQYENPALLLVTKSKEDELQISHLHHDIRYRREQVLEEARKYFGWKGSNEEIESMLKAKRNEIDIKKQPPLTQGLFLPGVFCDVQGTFLKNGKINEHLKKELEDYALEKPVNLWTGSDVGKMAFQVGNVRYPVLLKGDYRGAEVEIAIDDLTLDEFEKEYGIKARTFKKV
ncbi:MAG: hypothetical protein V1802_03525 [Candidatus Aenigmatarchaeota archaeon]